MIDPSPIPGVWAPARRRLTTGLILTVTLVALEGLSVATILPVVSRHLGDVRLYGWVFSAFFLSSLVGIVVAGALADRRGLAIPAAGGPLLFMIGLLIAGLAPDMPVLVVGRLVQGFGAGAVPATAYTAIGRVYPPELRPRMFAVLSSVWVVPSLIGPALAGFVAQHIGWRVVFLGLIPVVAVAAGLAFAPLRRVGGLPASAAEAGRERGALLFRAVRTATGAGLVLAGLTAASPLPTIALVAAGLVVGIPALRRLLPSGTLVVRRGLPAVVSLRGMLTFAFFTGDAYVPLTLTSIRHTSPTFAGLTLTAATLTWTAGSWTQARFVGIWGPRRLVVGGLVLIVIGLAGIAAQLSSAVPVGFGPLAWGVAGLGMGTAYSPISVAALDQAEPGHEGEASASIQLTDTLGTALGTGSAGALVALAHQRHWDPRLGLGLSFALGATAALVALACSHRLPRRLAGR